jgi:tRNA(fMet)-specific endonuclease VapC
MSGSAAVDSNAYIAMRAGDADAIALIGSFNRIQLPVVVLGELLYGAGASRRAEANRRVVREFAANCTLLELTQDVAERYSELKLHLRSAGKPVPDNDLWIAAACVAAGIPLITRDAHFAHLPALKVLCW